MTLTTRHARSSNLNTVFVVAEVAASRNGVASSGVQDSQGELECLRALYGGPRSNEFLWKPQHFWRRYRVASPTGQRAVGNPADCHARQAHPHRVHPRRLRG